MARVLVTNDDGIRSPGLAALAVELRVAGHEVVVAAPDRDISGSGTSLGTLEDGARVRCTSVELPDLDGIAAHAITAPPAFAVIAACLGALGPPPELVVVGVNDGLNLGRGIIHSSTVGAALTAAGAGRSAIAVSAGEGAPGRPDTAARVATSLAGWVLEECPRATVLNVNVPDLDLAELGGVTWAPLAPLGGFRLTVERDLDELVLHRVTRDLAADHAASTRATDASVVGSGRVAVTQLRSGPRVESRVGDLDLGLSLAPSPTAR